MMSHDQQTQDTTKAGRRLPYAKPSFTHRGDILRLTQGPGGLLDDGEGSLQFSSGSIS